jgi:uncharacterized protein (DUF2062 family)
MFKRRTPLSLPARIFNFIWPQPGWRRSSLYLWHRLHRLPGSTSAIAAGFACGAAVSMLPLSGLHFVLGALLAWAMRASVIASAFGTVVGNPWTFPAIWVGTYWLGSAMLGLQGQDVQALNFASVFEALWYGIVHLDGAHIMDKVWPVWWPMMVGSIPVSVVVWFACYIPLRRTMTGYHQSRGLRRLRRLAQQARREKPTDAPQEPARLSPKKDDSGEAA